MIPMTVLKQVSVVCVVLGLSACDSSIPPGVHGVVVDAMPGQTSSTLTIHSATVDGDALNIEVSHGGGCAQHGYELRWDGSFATSGGADEAVLVLAHDPHGDTCEALLSGVKSFDLTPIRDAWRRERSAQSGTVRLTIDRSDKVALYSF
ncbi:MAG: hypothetical protein WBV82_30910 [Myxococcaceae bacterium]